MTNSWPRAFWSDQARGDRGDLLGVLIDDRAGIVRLNEAWPAAVGAKQSDEVPHAMQAGVRVRAVPEDGTLWDVLGDEKVGIEPPQGSIEFGLVDRRKIVGPSQ
jgi:hypothetical protein